MAFFTFDETKAKEGFELVDEGNYEVTVLNAVAGKTQSGDDKITVDFEIRSDVNQKFQGAKILYNTFTFGNEISVGILTNLIKACGFPNGANFNTPADLANQLLNKTLQIAVRHEEYEKDGQKRKAAKSKFYNKSKLEPQQQTTVQSDDLPF